MVTQIGRRTFIAYTLFAGAGLCGGCLFACVPKVAASECVTTDDILGPYFRPQAPQRSDLRFKGITGDLLHVVGMVKAADCTTAITDAQIEVWHCSSDGAYDNTSSEFLYRGRFLSSKDGSYELKTIVPGRYLNGDSYRPAHIHFKISSPGKKTLVTQLYFSGDPYLESDAFSSQPKARMRILPIEDTQTEEKKVHFDIVLGS